MIMLLVIVMFLAVVVSMGYGIYHAMVKLEFVEGKYIALLMKVDATLTTMRALDSRQMFEKDDDVGTLFKQLVDTLEEMSQFVEGMENPPEASRTTPQFDRGLHSIASGLSHIDL